MTTTGYVSLQETLNGLLDEVAAHDTKDDRSPQVIAKGENVIARLDDNDEIKKLFGLKSKYQLANETAKLMYSLTGQLEPNVTETAAKAQIYDELFWLAVRRAAGTSAPEIGIRDGWLVVTPPEEPEEPKSRTGLTKSTLLDALRTGGSKLVN